MEFEPVFIQLRDIHFLPHFLFLFPLWRPGEENEKEHFQENDSRNGAFGRSGS
jgi:hypothetical protein